MVRTIARHDLLTSGEEASNLDGVLVGLSTAVREEKRVNVARSYLGQLGSQPRSRFGRHERIGIGKRLRLLVNCLNDALVSVPDVHGHELAIEINEALPFRRPEVNSLGFCNRDRVDLGLGRPLE